jgi:hypothetical protein
MHVFSLKISQYLTFTSRRNLKSRLLFVPFSTELKNEFNEGDGKKKVRKWKPKDPAAIEKLTMERLRDIQQLLPYANVSYNRDRKQEADVLLTRDMNFGTQFEVDTFIESSLSLCNVNNISDLMNSSAKVSKRNGKQSLLIKHLPAIELQIKELSSSSWTFYNISKVVYGLQHTTADDVGAIGILSLMMTASAKNMENNDAEGTRYFNDIVWLTKYD